MLILPVIPSSRITIYHNPSSPTFSLRRRLLCASTRPRKHCITDRCSCSCISCPRYKTQNPIHVLEEEIDAASRGQIPVTLESSLECTLSWISSWVAGWFGSLTSS